MKPIGVRPLLVLQFVTTGALCAQTATQPTARGPDGQSALVVSDSTSFWIDAPHGWVLDRESGKRDGALVVLYKTGESWRSGEPVMYASVITRKIGYSPFIVAAIRSDSANWAGSAKDLVFMVRDSVRATSGAFAQLRDFQSVANGHFDTIAYFQGEERVWMLALAARSRASHDAAYPEFLSLVKSYAPGPKITQQ